MVEFDRIQEHDLTVSSRVKICVVGVGGGGLNVLDRISLDRMMDANLVAMHTDVRILSHSMATSKVQLGASLMRGIGSGGDPELGCDAAEATRDQITASLQGYDMVFICCGLGGGTGSGAGPVIAQIAKDLGALVLVFATMPFSFEGRRRLQQAETALDELRSKSDALILFENNRMGEMVLPKEGIQKAFSQADQLIGHSVRAISTIVTQTGIVRMNLADLMAALRSPNTRCLFGYGESRGANRVSDALKRALKSPLINQGLLLQNARNLLVHVAGGENLTLAEVESLMKQLGKYVPDSTQIMFGLAVDPKLGESLCLTLLSSLSAQQMLDPVAAEAEVVPVTAASQVETVAEAESLPILDFIARADGASTANVPTPEVVQVPVQAPIAAPVVAEAAPVQPAQPVVQAAPAPLPPPVAVAPAPQPVVTAPAPVAQVMVPEVPVQAVPPAPVPVAAPPVAQVEVAPDLFAAPKAVAPQSYFQILNEVPAPTQTISSPVQAAPVQAAPVQAAPVQAAPVVEERIVVESAPPVVAEIREELPAPAPKVTYQPPAEVPPPVASKSIFTMIADDDDEEEEEIVTKTEAPKLIEDNGEHWAMKYMSVQPASPAPVQSVLPPRREVNAAPAPVASTAAPAANVPAKPQPAADVQQQATFNLQPQEVSRFKGTDKTIVEGEDLDVPTWLRLRQKVKG